MIEWANKQAIEQPNNAEWMKRNKNAAAENTWFVAHLCAFWSDGFQNISNHCKRISSVRILYIWFSHFDAKLSWYAVATAVGKTHRIRIQRIRKFHLYHSLAPFTLHFVSLFIFLSCIFGSSILYYLWIFPTIIFNGVKYSCCKSIFTCKNMQISRFKHKFHKLIRIIISNLSLNVVLFLLLLCLARILHAIFGMGMHMYTETGKWENERIFFLNLPNTIKFNHHHSHQQSTMILCVTANVLWAKFQIPYWI